MPKKSSTFRIGKVLAYQRGKVWYLCYHEHGRRRRPRIGSDKEAARQLAAQVNAQIDMGAPAALSFERIGIAELRERWLEHHELVLRSSVQTIERYRTATDHLHRFLDCRPVRHASQFHAGHAEQFVSYLRTVQVSPNGHPNTARRPLLDKGLRYVLECCRALFSYAAKRRYLPPYTENPFQALEIDRIPIEQARPITLFSPAQEAALLVACDDWQFPLFLTLLLTGLRPGELCHLLLPEDLDLEAAVLRVRNKPRLGWQVKTRNERDLPLLEVLVRVLRAHLGSRRAGTVFQARRWRDRQHAIEAGGLPALEQELSRRSATWEAAHGQPADRKQRLRLARGFWRDAGAVREDRVRTEFMGLTKAIRLAGCTAPKVLRHQFATTLQEGRVDPLIRNLLMGHATPGERKAGHGLGMTAVYTHSRPETVRRELEAAWAGRPVLASVEAWLAANGSAPQLELGQLLSGPVPVGDAKLQTCILASV
jgi:integrase